MKRNLTITLDQKSINDNLVFINNINDIVNYSCDSIEISVLEYIEDKNHKIIVDSLINKLRPSGRLIINFANAISIAENFIAYSITSKKFLDFFRNKQSILSIDLIYSMIDFNIVSIIDTSIGAELITIILERTAV